jgi:copper resistance protein D
MQHRARTASKYFWNFRVSAEVFVLLMLVTGSVVWSQEPPSSAMPNMQDMPGMEHHAMNGPAVPEDPAAAAVRLADKRGSEFNHHLAGLFLVLAGVVLLLEDSLAKRWPIVRYAWPMTFLAAGLFLFVFSDPEVWPIGDQTWGYALSHSLEVLQHKTFSLILLILGYVEFERARGRYKSLWAGFIFPIVGIAGAVLLLFHAHSGDMQAPHTMERMELIEKQHGWFAATGFGIALTKGLAVLPLKSQRVFRKVWPGLLVVLGCLLMLYTE